MCIFFTDTRNNCRCVYTERDKRNQLRATQARGAQITAQNELERETQHKGACGECEWKWAGRGTLRLSTTIKPQHHGDRKRHQAKTSKESAGDAAREPCSKIIWPRAVVPAWPWRSPRRWWLCILSAPKVVVRAPRVSQTLLPDLRGIKRSPASCQQRDPLGALKVSKCVQRCAVGLQRVPLDVL